MTVMGRPHRQDSRQHTHFLVTYHENNEIQARSRRHIQSADGRGFDPRVQHHSFVEIGHGIISTAILSLALIQVGQLSITGERMCT